MGTYRVNIKPSRDVKLHPSTHAVETTDLVSVRYHYGVGSVDTESPQTTVATYNDLVDLADDAQAFATAAVAAWGAWWTGLDSTGKARVRIGVGAGGLYEEP
jgi:hypothetical protein